MAQFSTLRSRVGYKLGYTPSSGTASTTTVINQTLNDAHDYLIDTFYGRKCWKPLHKLHKEVTYTLVADQEEYDVYTVIGSSTGYYGFVDAYWGDYKCIEIPIHEYNRVNDAGDLYYSTSHPFIIFWEYDSSQNMPKFKLRPEPTSADTLTFRYIATWTAMSNDGDTSSLDTYCDEIIVEFATAECLEREGRVQEAMLHRQKAENKLQKIIGTYEEPEWYEVQYEPVV